MNVYSVGDEYWVYDVDSHNLPASWEIDPYEVAEVGEDGDWLVRRAYPSTADALYDVEIIHENIFA